MYFNSKAGTWTCEATSNPDILEFHRSLPEYAETPLHRLPRSLCDEHEVGEILVKDESSRFGLPAFKILGASWGSLKSIERRLGECGPITSPQDLEDVRSLTSHARLQFFTATDGNHGRAVSRMARLFGTRCLVFVPLVTDQRTKDRIEQEWSGTGVIVVDGDYDETVREADSKCKEKGGILIQDTAWPGYEEVPKWIAQGYSTMMKEIDQQAIDLLGKAPNVVITPVGVGSLAHAVVSHYKTKDRQAKVVAVEPDTAACLKTSLEKGEITPISTGNTLMCGMNCGTVSCTAWPYLSAGIDACVTITDQEAQGAQKILDSHGIHVGPCAAATLAALKGLSGDARSQLGITRDSVMVLLATEGPR